MQPPNRRLAGVIAALAVTSACGGSSSTGSAGSTSPTPAGSSAASPMSTAVVDAARFTGPVDNPWFPLPVGGRWVYRGTEDGKATRDIVVVTQATKLIAGVTCVVVRDDVFTEGRLSEHTLDYYAQDVDGTVWYFGEDTAELDKQGHPTSREGTWRTGRDGARPGIIMLAHPRVGDAYSQEHYRGHAEDHARVVDGSGAVTTPASSSRHALITVEWTPLEPKIREHKYYVRGIGQVKEDVFRGGQEESSLVSYTGLG